MCIELAPFIGVYDLVGIGDCRRLVEAFAERVADEGARRRVMATHACVDVPDQLPALGDGDTSLHDP
jgi:hypothetical protein